MRLESGGEAERSPNSCSNESSSESDLVGRTRDCRIGDLLGIVVQPLDLHLVNVGSIPTGPTHGEVRLRPHPADVLKSTPYVRKSPR